ncbi:MAG: low molecular weight phosphatase family protein [Proteobacteria bacterium]|nr:low molecular weight phosphatase family protein [Pseudomonadota bacterium]
MISVQTPPKYHSVLFCCDHNSIRSPMAEGLMKAHVGKAIFVQSAGVKGDLDIDGYAIAVCAEVGVELARHKVRSFQELEELGDGLQSYDLIVALSERAETLAREHTRTAAVEVQYWPTPDPTGQGVGESRAVQMDAYRAVRDSLMRKIRAVF